MPDKNCPCTQHTKVSKIKVEENGKKAVFLNTKKSPYRRVQVDGCLLNGVTAADWLVVEEDIGSVVIELKGRDVDHALEQVEAALTFIKKKNIYPPRLAALIVCSGRPTHPSFTTKLQRIKESFAKKFQAPIHIVTGNHEFELKNVLSFKGPHAGG